METIVQPKKEEWAALCSRPELDSNTILQSVEEIFEQVKSKGDVALKEYTLKFDGANLNNIKCNVDKLSANVSDELKRSIKIAYNNIKKFHKTQGFKTTNVETSKGVKCWQEAVGIEKVGIYIPGGSAALFSTVLMLAIPAKLAGCKEIIVCTPPDKLGNVNPTIVYTAKLCGIKYIYKVGGSQAIAAMTYGTETIPSVSKIFGPGNQYVTLAKQIASTRGVAIDMPAGPSEVLIIADKTANASYVAADLLSQAEHGPDSQVILLTDSKKLITAVKKEIEVQLERLPRKKIASKALENSRVILLKNTNECMEFSNAYAPEHLILNCKEAEKLANRVLNAGSVFIGKWSCESAGDYASGTNHTLPTNGYATAYSGVSLTSFQKTITFQKLTAKGIKNIENTVVNMANAEGLDAHANAVSIRIKDL